MPGFFEPNYEAWKEMLERFDVNEKTILVGHSCGGGFLIRYLSENNVQVGKVILVAPWLDPDKEIDPNFFEFEIDPSLMEKTDGITVMYSTDDMESVLTTINLLKSNTKDLQFQEFNDQGHFVLNSMKSEKFPELLNNLI